MHLNIVGILMQWQPTSPVMQTHSTWWSCLAFLRVPVYLDSSPSSPHCQAQRNWRPLSFYLWNPIYQKYFPRISFKKKRNEIWWRALITGTFSNWAIFTVVNTELDSNFSVHLQTIARHVPWFQVTRKSRYTILKINW